MAAQPDIPFKYPQDGCYARAHRMAYLLDKKGIRSVKVFAEGHLHVETPNSPTGSVDWWYHVAPSVAVQGPDGKINMMVIDPSIFDHPVSVKEWVAIQTKISKKAKVYFTERFNLSAVGDDDPKDLDLRKKKWSRLDLAVVEDALAKNMRQQNGEVSDEDQLGPPAGSGEDSTW